MKPPYEPPTVTPGELMLVQDVRIERPTNITGAEVHTSAVDRIALADIAAGHVVLPPRLPFAMPEPRRLEPGDYRLFLMLVRR
jgi:hypothetical protein